MILFNIKILKMSSEFNNLSDVQYDYILCRFYNKTIYYFLLFTLFLLFSKLTYYFALQNLKLHCKITILHCKISLLIVTIFEKIHNIIGCSNQNILI